MEVRTATGRGGPVGVVGAGVMGRGIAQAFAQHGYRVTCQDVSADQLARAEEAVHTGRFGLERAVARGRLTRDEAARAADRLRWTTDLGALADGALVIESVPEDPTLKRAVLADLGAVVGADTVIATNTSGLPLASLRDAVPDPGRFLAWHWASPAVVSRFAELVVHDATDPAVVEVVRGLAVELGRNPVVVRDDPHAWGFVANRIYAAVLTEAAAITEAGLCAPEDVDRLVIDAFGWPAGPYGLARGAADGWESRDLDAG